MIRERSAGIELKVNTIIMEVFVLLWRYACAIPVALLVWALVTVLGVTVIHKGFIEFLSGAHNQPMYPAISFGIAYTATFLGVLSGARCLPLGNRILGGLVILFIGLAYYFVSWFVYLRHAIPSKHGNDPLLIEHALGGACAVWAIVDASRRSKSALRDADGRTRHSGIWTSRWWRFYLIGISAGFVLGWLVIIVDRAR